MRRQRRHGATAGRRADIKPLAHSSLISLELTRANPFFLVVVFLPRSLHFGIAVRRAGAPRAVLLSGTEPSSSAHSSASVATRDVFWHRLQTT